jgi:CubicO group peptidase (beta-lactamase class C family)
VSDANAQVRAVLEQLIAGRNEVGLQIAAYLDGDLVVDTWAGLADEQTKRPVDGDTMFTVFSTGKGVVATCIHMLADRGLLDYDDAIARHWPEFGVNGKETATIRHALTHQTGIPHLPPGYDTAMMIDWQRMVDGIANLTPRWQPGTACGYHGVTYGYVLGEVLRRVDGRDISTFLQEEVCAPLGIDSMFFGVPAEQEHRVARLKDHDDDPDAVGPTQYLSNLRVDPEFNRSDVRRASLPAHGGIMTARAIASHYAMLLAGGAWKGERLLTPERVQIATRPQYEGDDLTIGLLVRRALGYSLGGTGLGAIGDQPEAFGHGGVGGSIGFADPERHIAFGFAKNYMEPRGFDDDSATVVYRAVLDSLHLPR